MYVYLVLFTFVFTCVFTYTSCLPPLPQLHELSSDSEEEEDEGDITATEEEEGEEEEEEEEEESGEEIFSSITADVLSSLAPPCEC